MERAKKCGNQLVLREQAPTFTIISHLFSIKISTTEERELSQEKIDKTNIEGEETKQDLVVPRRECALGGSSQQEIAALQDRPIITIINEVY